MKGDGSRICVIDPYHVISKILHSGNCGLADKKIHQNAGDCHKQCSDQCQTPLKRNLSGYFFHFISSVKM